MQRIGAIIDGKGIGLAVQSKFTFGDPVAVAPYDRSKVRLISQITFERIESQDDVGLLAIAVWRVNGNDAGTVGRNPRFDLSII